MVDIIVDGLRINWANKGALRFYEGKTPTWPAPAEPDGFGPPKVAASCSGSDTAAVVTSAAESLIAAIAILHPSIMAIADSQAIVFADGRQLSGVQIKSVWQHGRFVVNDSKYGADRGGATLAALKESQIRHDTVSGYRAHGDKALWFIILHEFMHMVQAGIDFWKAEYDAYRHAEGRGDEAGANYDGNNLNFRRTEQYVNAATRKLLTLAGLPVIGPYVGEGAGRHASDNMPPFGYDLEPGP